MADAQLKHSRRTLIGAACAAPVLSGVKGPFTAGILSVRSERSRGPVPSAAEAPTFAMNGKPPSPPSAPPRPPSPRSKAATTTTPSMPPSTFSTPPSAVSSPSPPRHVATLADKSVLSEVEGLEIAAAAKLQEMTYAPPALAALARDARTLSSS